MSKISPLAYGLDPSNYEVGTVKEGANKLNWIIEQKKNKKKWVRIYDCSTLSHEEPLIKESLFQKFFIENIKTKSFETTMQEWYIIKNL
jgi:hypothetical protein